MHNAGATLMTMREKRSVVRTPPTDSFAFNNSPHLRKLLSDSPVMQDCLVGAIANEFPKRLTLFFFAR